MKLRPCAGQVLVRRVYPEFETDSGIAIPYPLKEKEAIVLAVGPGCTTRRGVSVEPEVKQGDRVLIAWKAGAVFMVDGDELVMIEEKDILGIVEDVEVVDCS